MQPDGVGYTIEYQTSLRACQQRLPVREFATCELNRLGGASGAQALPTGGRFVALLLREIWASARRA